MPEQGLTAFLDNPWLLKGVKSVVAVIGTWLAIAVVSRALVGRISDNESRYRVRKFVSATGYLVLAVILMSIFATDLGGLKVALGVAGAGIAFALQELIGSIASWFVITTGRMYSTGDRILIGGIRGDVIDIGIVRTTVMECGDWVAGDLYNGRIVKISNNAIFKDPVFNYSTDFPFLWDELVVPIRFGSDVERTEKLLLDVTTDVVGNYAREAAQEWQKMLTKYRIEQARVDPMVTIRFDENWIRYTVRYVVDYKARRNTAHDLSKRILAALAAKPEIATLAGSSLEVTMMNPPAANA